MLIQDVFDTIQAWRIEAALSDYLPEMVQADAWQNILTALRRTDRDGSADGADFARKGDYTFAVKEDRGTLALWMYEDKGDLVIHKDVDAEAFIYNDEFYFTVNRIADGKVDTTFSGVYKAYPEKVYDEVAGEERARLDRDAWLVWFEEGKIKNARQLWKRTKRRLLIAVLLPVAFMKVLRKRKRARRMEKQAKQQDKKEKSNQDPRSP